MPNSDSTVWHLPYDILRFSLFPLVTYVFLPGMLLYEMLGIQVSYLVEPGNFYSAFTYDFTQ